MRQVLQLPERPILQHLLRCYKYYTYHKTAGSSGAGDVDNVQSDSDDVGTEGDVADANAVKLLMILCCNEVDHVNDGRNADDAGSCRRS